MHGTYKIAYNIKKKIVRIILYKINSKYKQSELTKMQI